MIGLSYSHNARYLVADESGKTIARFNSLAKAKLIASTLKAWRIYDLVDSSAVSNRDTAKWYDWFLDRSTDYPHMVKCAKLFRRYKKSSKKVA